jgi:micrococcal nuclease
LCKVISITDGDTFKVLHSSRGFIIRLEHIDCPEKQQPFGTKAKKYLSDLCFGKLVRIISGGKRDRYNRVIGVAYLDSLCINKMMIACGMAWHYKKYSTDEDYSRIEIVAQNEKLGIWSESKPTPPWNWRKNKK